MIKVASGSGNTHVLHIKAVVIHLAPLPVVMHHEGRQHGKMVSIIIIDSPEMIFFVVASIITTVCFQFTHSL